MRVRRLQGERFLDACTGARVQAGGGSVQIWAAFHSGAKTPLVTLDRNVTGVVYRDIMQNSLVPFARHHFGANFHYQDDNTTCRRARVQGCSKWFDPPPYLSQKLVSSIKTELVRLLKKFLAECLMVVQILV